jgi:hypothetical protein
MTLDDALSLIGLLLIDGVFIWFTWAVMPTLAVRTCRRWTVYTVIVAVFQSWWYGWQFDAHWAQWIIPALMTRAWYKAYKREQTQAAMDREAIR